MKEGWKAGRTNCGKRGQASVGRTEKQVKLIEESKEKEGRKKMNLWKERRVGMTPREEGKGKC